MNNKSQMALLLAGLVSLQGSLAQDALDDPAIEDVDEATMLGRDRTWRLGLGIAAEYDDNIYRTPENEENSFKVQLRPRFQWEMPLGPFRYTLNLQTEFGFFDAESSNDYFDQVLSAQVGWSPDIRHNFNFGGSFTTSHDPLGTNRTDSIVDEDQDPDEWYQWSLDGKYLFGAPEARGNLEFRGGYARKAYTNNEEVTNFLDRRTFNLGSSFYYRVAPATRAVISADYEDTDYDDTRTDGGDRGFQVYRLRAGVTWLATAKTSGEVLGGYYWTDFEDSSQGDSEGFDWRININWLPRTYSTFTLTSGLNFVDGNTRDTTTVETRDVGLSWDHQWRDRIGSNAYVEYIRADHEGIDREDSILGFGASVDYALGRNYGLGAGYRFTDRDSDDDIYDFSRNVFFVEFNAEF